MEFSKGEIICRGDLASPEGALMCDGYDDGAGCWRIRWAVGSN